MYILDILNIQKSQYFMSAKVYITDILRFNEVAQKVKCHRFFDVFYISYKFLRQCQGQFVSLQMQLIRIKKVFKIHENNITNAYSIELKEFFVLTMQFSSYQ